MFKHSTLFTFTSIFTICLGGLTWIYAQKPAETSDLTTQDYIDIRHVYARYNDTIDDGDAEGWVAVWTDDGDFNGFKGKDELLRFAKHYIDHQDGALRRHWINNLHITETPEGANAENYFMILDVSVTPPAVFSTGKNLDTFIRTANGWMFKSRTTWSADGERITNEFWRERGIDIGN